jgi:hypothetical protein
MRNYITRQLKVNAYRFSGQLPLSISYEGADMESEAASELLEKMQGKIKCGDWVVFLPTGPDVMNDVLFNAIFKEDRPTIEELIAGGTLNVEPICHEFQTGQGAKAEEDK